jgi:hypothetical protein
MPDPVPSFYENDSTPPAGTVINGGNPIAYGNITRGLVGVPTDAQQLPIHLWNDKNVGTAKTMEQVKIGVKDSLGGNSGFFIAGTALNGNKPFYEAKSTGALNCPDDAQLTYSPIGGVTMLLVGDIPANARRHIWIQCNVPADSVAGSLNALFVVDYTFVP